jgi:tRNA(fMet)-specific endonuclease VapC
VSLGDGISGVVVDTDVISLVFKQDTRAMQYRPHLHDRQLVVSFMTVAELQRWALERRWGERRRSELARYLKQFTALYATEELCGWWASVMVGARQKGHRIEVADAWIAATSLLYGLPLVTHNPGDYRGVDGLRTISEAGS